MSEWVEVVKVGVPLVGGLGMGGIVVKFLNRPLDQAEVAKIHVEARETAVQAAQTELQIMRDILTEVRANDSIKTGLLATQANEISGIKERISHLEERERHMLTRAAVHEAWDQLAFQALLAQNPEHPPPPPLSLPGSSL